VTWTGRPRAGAHWFLCGFSGAGKSTVGRTLAARAGRAFVDLDDAIATRVGIDAAAWLAAQGEDRFRSDELAALRDALAAARGPLVVALGGGALERSDLAELVRRRGLLAWLDAPLETCLRRLEADAGSRPILDAARREGGAAAVARLHGQRRVRYATADVRVEAGGSDSATCAALLEALAAADDRAGARGGRSHS